MKLAVFSDIHGNISFFEAFLKDAEKEKVDRFVFLGDAVSYYPFGCEVIQKLQDLGALCIEGNHDSMLRGEFPIPENHEPVYQLRSVISEITPEDMAYVKSWPEIVHETLDGKRLTFVHGNPLNHLKGYSYADSELALYDDPSEDIVFVGHTHRPWIRKNPHTLMVNVGSVGLPRDEGGGSKPAWVLYDSQTGIPEIRRVNADITPLLALRGKVHESVLDALKR